MTLAGTGAANAQTFTVSEAGYATTFFSLDTCHPTGGAVIANFAPTAPTGPSATVAATGVNAGQCSITYSDTFGQQQTVQISVVVGGIGLH